MFIAIDRFEVVRDGTDGSEEVWTRSEPFREAHDRAPSTKPLYLGTLSPKGSR